MILGKVTTPKAAREHECWSCGEMIVVGEIYVAFVWKKGNELETIKVHERCRGNCGHLSDVGGPVSDEGEDRFCR